MSKIVISGATSFIASNLIEELDKNNNTIYAIIRKNTTKKDKLTKYKNITIIELNKQVKIWTK